MSTTSHSSRAGSSPTTRVRRRARIAGTLYLITFITSIPTLALYGPLRDHSDFVLGVGDTTGVKVGVLLEVALAVACAGTAVALFPVLRRQSESAALGFLAARVVEAALILMGVVSLLSILALRADAAGAPAADPGSLVTAGSTLLAVYDGTFLLGQSLMPVVSALCLGSVMYRYHLVPRIIPAIGLFGAPLLLASDIAVLLGVYPQGTAPAALAALPIAFWELALGVWLVAKGFRSAAFQGVPDANSNADRLQAERGSMTPRSSVDEPKTSSRIAAHG